MSQGYHLVKAFTGEEWLNNVSVFIDECGDIIELKANDSNPTGLPVIEGPVIPGIANLHSHAFQYAMAGLTELRRNPVDTFWSWREMMYHFCLRLSPEDQCAIASKLYLECLKRGYTSVAEFHYIHNQPDGSAYQDVAEMSLATLAAAKAVGIQLTHLPVFYAHSDFGGKAPTEMQRRFVSSIEGFARMLETLAPACKDQDAILGIAAHSLRAVSESELAELTQLHGQLSGTAPFHIHIAEQVQEVESCLQYCGKRPVERLFELADVDQRWCLVHATHMTQAETRLLADSGAVAGLCPLTEANLGDGIFNAVDYLHNGGVYGIGSDSNVSCDPFAELQMLEYSQRLGRRERTVLASSCLPNTGASLYAGAAMGGARAAGRKAGKLAVGYAADFVELRGAKGRLSPWLPDSALLDHQIFAQDSHLVGDVVTKGKRVLENGTHPQETKINSAFAAAMQALCREL